MLWPRVRRGAGSQAEQLSVLIPARDEEKRLPACLEAVLGQPCVSEILIYDDHSQDQTREVAQRYAERDNRARLIPAEPLPEGWRGKTFACQMLASHAQQPWLLFLDADAILAQGATAAILEEAIRRRVTLLSCWPGIDMGGFWEKLLMPMLNFVVLTLYPAPLAMRRKDASLGLAHGALILAQKQAYWRVGGHAAVRGELFEDTVLARVWRQKGESSLCLDGQDVVRTRMYESLKEIWAGFQKNFYPAFRFSVTFWGFLALHGFVFLGPFLLGSWGAAGLVLAMRAALALRFRHSLWSVLLHPVAETMLLALGLVSWWRFRHGSGVEWKGRRYSRL